MEIGGPGDLVLRGIDVEIDRPGYPCYVVRAWYCVDVVEKKRGTGN